MPDSWKRRTSVCRFASGHRSSRWRIWPPYPSPSRSRAPPGDASRGCGQTGDATSNGKPGVLTSVHKQPFFNTLADAAMLRKRLRNSRLPCRSWSCMPRALAVDVHSACNWHQWNSRGLRAGCAGLGPTSFQWRTVVISLTAIPLSLLGAILVLGVRRVTECHDPWRTGDCFGREVVDDAIVDVENVVRRLWSDRPRLVPASPIVSGRFSGRSAAPSSMPASSSSLSFVVVL